MILVIFEHLILLWDQDKKTEVAFEELHVHFILVLKGEQSDQPWNPQKGLVWIIPAMFFSRQRNNYERNTTNFSISLCHYRGTWPKEPARLCYLPKTSREWKFVVDKYPGIFLQVITLEKEYVVHILNIFPSSFFILCKESVERHAWLRISLQIFNVGIFCRYRFSMEKPQYFFSIHTCVFLQLEWWYKLLEKYRLRNQAWGMGSFRAIDNTTWDLRNHCSVSQDKCIICCAF